MIFLKLCFAYMYDIVAVSLFSPSLSSTDATESGMKSSDPWNIGFLFELSSLFDGLREKLSVRSPNVATLF